MIIRYILFSLIILFLSPYSFTQNTDSIRERYTPRHPQDIKRIPTKTDQDKSKKISINILGYVKLLATSDWGNIQNTSEFITSAIPIYPNAREKSQRFSFDPRQSRLALEGIYQITNTNKLKIYLEIDFYNTEAITSYVPHMRHAYAEYGSFILGHTYSTAFNIEACPNQVDFEGANSVLGRRQAQIRYTYYKEKFSFAVAAETHLEDFTPYPGVDEIKDFQKYPDLIAYLQTQGKWGNLRLTGIFRNISYTDSSKTKVDELWAWGVNISAYVNIFHRSGINDVLYGGFTFGKGVAYYISDLSGLGYDAMPDKNNIMNSLPVYGGYAAYKHTWNLEMESNIIASFVGLNNSDFNNEMMFDNTIYGAINFMYNPLDRINFGIEFLYGKNTNKKQDWGEGYRIQLMSAFNF